MAAPIAPVATCQSGDPIQAPVPSPWRADNTNGNMFQSMFNTAVNTVQGVQDNANKAIENFLSGNNRGCPLRQCSRPSARTCRLKCSCRFAIKSFPPIRKLCGCRSELG